MNKVIQTFKSSTNNMVWRYYAYCFLSSMTFFSAVLVPFFTDWGRISQFQIQLLQSWFMFWIFVLEVPTGAIADYIGRKYSVALGAVAISIGALTYGSMPSFGVFLLAEFIFALGVALTSGADQALVYDSLKERGEEEKSKEVLSRARSFDLGGMLFGATVGGFIAAKFGLNAPMLFTMVPVFLSALIVWTLKEPKMKSTKETKRYLKIFKEGFKFFAGHKQLRALATDVITVGASAYFVIWFYQRLLQNISFPVQYFGFVHAALVGVEMLITANFVFLERLVGGAKNYFRYTALITSLGFLAVAISPNLYVILVFTLLAGGFGLTRQDVMGAYLNKHIPSEQRATVLSSISMFRRFTLVALNPVMGFAADKSLVLGLLLAAVLSLSVFFFSPIEKEMFEEEV